MFRDGFHVCIYSSLYILFQCFLQYVVLILSFGNLLSKPKTNFQPTKITQIGPTRSRRLPTTLVQHKKMTEHNKVKRKNKDPIIKEFRLKSLLDIRMSSSKLSTKQMFLHQHLSKVTNIQHMQIASRIFRFSST